METYLWNSWKLICEMGGNIDVKSLGNLNVSQYSGNTCNSDVYFPSEIPTGVGAPNDPLFDVRNQVYAITFGKRQ